MLSTLSRLWWTSFFFLTSRWHSSPTTLTRPASECMMSKWLLTTTLKHSSAWTCSPGFHSNSLKTRRHSMHHTIQSGSRLRNCPDCGACPESSNLWKWPKSSVVSPGLSSTSTCSRLIKAHSVFWKHLLTYFSFYIWWPALGTSLQLSTCMIIHGHRTLRSKIRSPWRCILFLCIGLNKW